MRCSPIEDADLSEVLALNRACVPEVGAVDTPALRRLVAQSTVALQLRDKGGLAGFVLALEAEAPYGSPNFRWFCAHLDRFLYVDRIAVAARCRGVGVGRALYGEVFGAARTLGLGLVTCEVNLLPANPGSQAFHRRLGFRPVGELQHVPGEKEVELLVAGARPRSG